MGPTRTLQARGDSKKRHRRNRVGRWHTPPLKNFPIFYRAPSAGGRPMYCFFCPGAPGLARSVANDNADILPRMSWHTEGNIFGTALLRKLTKSEIVTGTISEFQWHANEVEMTADRPTNSVTARVDGAVKTRWTLQSIPSDNQSRRSHLALGNDGHSPSQLTTRTH